MSVTHPTTDLAVTGIPMSPLLSRKRPANRSTAELAGKDEAEEGHCRPRGDGSWSSYDPKRYCIIGRNKGEKTLNLLLSATGQIGTFALEFTSL
jgi:hypothetical protein